MKKFGAVTVVLAVFVLASCAQQRRSASPASPVAVVGGFDVPECALVDPQTGFIYVSNIKATPEMYWSDNGKGFISRLHPDGTIDAPRWIDSRPEFVLNSPKGMCLLDGRLYVADNTRGLVFALDSGRPLRALVVDRAERLNDMANDGMHVYVSDTRAGRILCVDTSGQGRHETVAELEGVNGITFDGKRMYAVSWDLHEVYEIDRSGRQPPQPFGLANHFVNLDGIEVLDDGSFLVSDFLGNRVVRISKDRRTVTTVAELQTPADIGLDRANRRLFVPQLTADKVAIYPLP